MNNSLKIKLLHLKAIDHNIETMRQLKKEIVRSALMELI